MSGGLEARYARGVDVLMAALPVANATGSVVPSLQSQHDVDNRANVVRSKPSRGGLITSD